MNKYILIAGVNGAGKSTLYESIPELKSMSRINTDEIIRTIGSWKNPNDVMKAGKLAIKKINELLLNKESFNQETTLCGKSILKNIQQAKKLGYIIEMHYIGIEDVEIAKKRVAFRVKNGGHGIPEADIERRYYESFKQLNLIKDQIDLLIFYDNTECFQRFAFYQKGIEIKKSNKTPKWFQQYIHFYQY